MEQRKREENKEERKEDEKKVDSTNTSSSPSHQHPFQIHVIQNENGISEFRFDIVHQVVVEQDVDEQDVVAAGNSQSPDAHEDSKDKPDDANPQTPTTTKTSYDCKCRICGKEFMKEKNLQLHYKLHLGEKDYMCSVCNKSYFTKSGLQAHQRQMHSSDDNSFFPCDHCDLFFSTRYEMVNHYLTIKKKFVSLFGLAASSNQSLLN